MGLEAKPWEKFYNTDTIFPDLFESPALIRLPVGDYFSVTAHKGININGTWWKAQPAFIVEENIGKLKNICKDWEDHGFELVVGDRILEKDWHRGWVTEYAKLSKDKQIMRCYLPGMVEVSLEIKDIDKAADILTRRSDIPVCPVVDAAWYVDNELVRTVTNTSAMYFLHYILYGEPLDLNKKAESYEDYMNSLM